MKRNLKFIWGSSQVIRGRWFFGVLGLYDRRGCPTDGMAVSVRGLLGWLLAAMVPAYLAGAAALFWVWQHDPYSTLTYSDALWLPVRREELRQKSGQALIAQGQDLFRAGKYHDAAHLLRLGLVRYPQGVRGRLLLAQYHLWANQRPAALRVMSEGLTAELPGRAYLESLFNLAEQAEDYGRVALLSDRYLRGLTSPADERTRRWLVERKFNALSAAGRWQDALMSVEREPPGDVTGERRVLARLGLHQPAEALALLQAWQEIPGADLQVVTRLQVRALQEAGRFEEMGGALLRLRELSPSDPAPAVFGVVQQAIAGRESAAALALEDYLFRFGATPENLLLVAQPLADVDNPSLLQRSVMAAAERGYPANPFQMLLVQSCVRRGEWDAAAGMLAAMPMESGRDAARRGLERDWLQHLITAAQLPTEAAQRALLESLRDRPWRIGVFHTSIEALVRAERFTTAHDVLGVALTAFPASAGLRAQAEEVLAAARPPVRSD